MTDYSQAIVNGANIALGFRSQRMREESMRLDESYRRDTLRENTRQFGLDMDFKNKALTQADTQFNAGLAQRKVEAENTRVSQAAANAIDSRRVGVLEQAANDERTAKANMAAARLYIMGIATNNGEAIANAMSTHLGVPQNREEAGKQASGDPNFFNSKKDPNVALSQVVYNPKTDSHIVGNFDDPKNPRVMDDKRTPDNQGKPVQISGPRLAELTGARVLQTPEGMAVLAEYLAARGYDTANMAPEDVVRKGAEQLQKDSQESQKGQARVDALAAQAQQPPTTYKDPTTGELIGGYVHEGVSQGLSDLGGALGTLASPLRGARDFAKGALFGAAPTPAAAPAATAAAPAAASPAAAPNLAAAPASAAAPAQRTGPATQAWMLRQAGLATDGDSVGALQATGQPDSKLAYAAAIAGGQRGTPGKAQDARLSSYVETFFPQSSKNPYGPETKAMAASDIVLMDDMTGGNILGGHPLGRSAGASLSSIYGYMRNDDSEYAEALQSNAPLRAGLALAAINPGEVGEDQFDSVVERLLNLQNTQAMSPVEIAQAAQSIFAEMGSRP